MRESIKKGDTRIVDESKRRPGTLVTLPDGKVGTLLCPDPRTNRKSWLVYVASEKKAYIMPVDDIEEADNTNSNFTPMREIFKVHPIDND